MMTETLANIHVHKQKKVEKGGLNGKMSSQISMFQHRNGEEVKRSGSFVIGQKLRESKWFTHVELKIFCAVVETGFIIEQKTGEDITYGVAVWTPSFEKSKDSAHLTIYTLHEVKGKLRVLAQRLEEFWPEDTQVRINNKSDKTETPLSEANIRNQVSAAQSIRRKWHNAEHFAYYCRYGPIVTNIRLRKLTDTLILKIRGIKAK